MKYLVAHRLARMAAAGAAAWLALAPSSALAADAVWESWVHVPGVLDLDGPRSDGTFVVAGLGELFLLDSEGKLSNFARGSGGYREDPGLETYLAVSPGTHVDKASCDWAKDETYILRLHAPFGVNRVNAEGTESGPFTNIAGVTVLTGITFDTNGSFDHRMLVLGIAGTKSVVVAVDCNGATEVITRTLPSLEGQMAVAPDGFGAFGGDLIIPEERGRILAVAPNGLMRVVLAKLPAGVDKTIGGLGFVPAGFTQRGGAAYHADRKTHGSAWPGTDTVLRLTSQPLIVAGVQDGDLLAAAEDGGALISVRCAETCTAVRLTTPTRAHAEGHIAFALNPEPSPMPTPLAAKVGRPLLPQGVVDFVGYWGIPAGAFALLVAFIAALALQAIRQRAR